jgi:dihydroflavonol-4-reductase
MSHTLITGATGFIGSHLSPLLLERGDEVLATVRPSSATERLDELGIATITADICDRRAIRRAMAGVERVFHVAGTTRFADERTRCFQVNVEGTRIVLEEALRAGVERAVLVSSIAAIGPAPAGQVADESNVWDAGRHGIPYVDAKREAEVTATRLVGRGLPLVIVNPAIVMGPGDPGRSSTSMVRRFMRRQIPAYVDGTINVVGVEDVVRGIIRAEERGVVGERYILGNRNYTMDRLFADLGRLSGIEPPPIKLPLAAALALAQAGRAVPGLHLPTEAEIRATSLRWAVSSKKAKRELRWETSPHEDCLEDTIAYYRSLNEPALPPEGTRQPIELRLAGWALRWMRLNRR